MLFKIKVFMFKLKNFKIIMIAIIKVLIIRMLMFMHLAFKTLKCIVFMLTELSDMGYAIEFTMEIILSYQT